MILLDFIGEFFYYGAIAVEDLIAGSILKRMRWRSFTALKHYYNL